MNKFKQTGGCQCGAVRFTLKVRPKVIYLCHCTECQKQSSSAFGISVRVNAADVELEGELATFERNSLSGPMECKFCPNCGTRIFHKRKTYGETQNIKGGTFDDNSWIKPSGHIWTGSKQPWLKLPQDDIAYEGQPDSFDALINAYAKEN